jgi:hypothetical protein
MAPEELLARRIAKLERALKGARDKGFKQMWESHIAHLKQLQKRKLN